MHPRAEQAMLQIQRQYIDPASGTVPPAQGYWGSLIEFTGQGLLAGKLYQTNVGVPIDATKATHLWLGQFDRDYVIVFGPGMEILPDPYTDPGHRNQWVWIDFNVGSHDGKRHVLATDLLLPQDDLPVVPFTGDAPASAPPPAKAKAAARA
jgi:hypothetical protein